MTSWTAIRHGLLAGVMPLAAVSAAPQGTGTTQAAPLDAARAAASAQLQRELELQVETMRVIEPWAFVSAQLRTPQGQPFDYAGTRWAEAAQHGAVSRRYVVLLKRAGGTWTPVEDRVGPTDVAWSDWSARHGAPAALFEMP